VATAFALGEGRSVSCRHVIGAMPLSGDEPPHDIATSKGRMRLTAEGGSTSEVPFDSDFLRIANMSRLSGLPSAPTLVPLT
jgi:hypothetical protein